MLMDSSFWCDTINFGKSIVHIWGCRAIIFNKYCVILSGDLFCLYIADPDEMPLYAAFHLGLHCL